MPKEKRRSPSRTSGHRHHKKKRKLRERSRERSSEVRAYETSRDTSSSRNSSPQVLSQESMTGVLKEILAFMRQHDKNDVSAAVEENPPTSPSFLFSESVNVLSPEIEFTNETDEQTVSQNRGVGPGIFSRYCEEKI